MIRIDYTITSGSLPITVQLVDSGESVYDTNVHTIYESGYFENIPEDTYTINFINSLGRLCNTTVPIAFTTTTTTTILPTTTTTTTTDPNNNPSTTNLLAYWAFEETSGTTAFDSHTNSYDGTNSAGVTINQTGKVDKCYNYSGVDRYTNMGNVAALDIKYDEPASIGIWAKFDNISQQYHTFMSKLSESSAYQSSWLWSYYYIAGTNEFLYLQYYGTSSGNYRSARVLDWVPTLDTWYHIVFTNDGTDSANCFKAYINGSEQTVTKLEVGTVLEAYPATNFNLGSIDNANSTTDKSFQGSLDEAFIYKKVLSQDEVLWLYNGGNGRSYSEL